MLEQFENQRFAVLETYRKNGSAVRTPLLIVIHRHRLYMRTGSHTYKVKRILNNSNVRVAPSTFKGEILGDWLKGQAKVYDAADMQWVNKLSKHRNGWFKRLIDLRNHFRRVHFVVIEIQFQHYHSPP